ncbi:cysteine hydrolase family protein [Paludibaculum fermentans]|uniref:Cysteine hydrolase n=1 Tax=Paludibaculum fermentans TaxID=1473598 RepID=A0A7S7SHS1_PALFE|nr:cysteine hydrolase family protein [Paludibaculum fermentans]QOY85269.1 cysteine hydrolase [Paludibaculum fermentans]
MESIPATAALILIDLQHAIDHPSWGVRNNPNAEQVGASLLAAWRDSGRAVYHVRHDSVEPHSTYRPGQPGHDFKSEFVPHADEPVTGKHTGSAFEGTELGERMATGCHEVLVVFGVITNNSVESTVRHAACLGYQVFLVADACFTFAKVDWNGVLRSADEVHAMSLANLHGEYCTVATAAEIMGALS